MKKKVYTGDIDNLIALCHIIDEFPQFERNLLSAMHNEYNSMFVSQLFDVSKGKSFLLAHKAKKFYNENKNVIDTINRYSNIFNFINSNYSWYESSVGTIRFFYKYLCENRDKKYQILSVLERMKQLGFNVFEFDENADFTKETYGVYYSFDRNDEISCVANAEVIPSYETFITYKTNDSAYKMQLRVGHDNISWYGRRIILNSLVFDPNSLPKKIDRESTHGKLLDLKKEQKALSDTIIRSVDLGVSIIDLDAQVSRVNRVIERMDSAKNLSELIEVSRRFREDLEKMKKLSDEYNRNISESEPLLTPEILESEKTEFLRRRRKQELEDFE